MPWHAASLICFWSSLLTVPTWLLSEETQLLNAPIEDIVLQLCVQGILAGMLGLATYAISIRYLGAAIAAVNGALIPPTTLIGAAIFLNEPITFILTVGVIVITLGIALFAGILGLLIKK